MMWVIFEAETVFLPPKSSKKKVIYSERNWLILAGNKSSGAAVNVENFAVLYSTKEKRNVNWLGELQRYVRTEPLASKHFNPMGGCCFYWNYFPLGLDSQAQ